MRMRWSENKCVPCFKTGASPVEPQTAELGPEVKSGHAYGKFMLHTLKIRIFRCSQL